MSTSSSERHLYEGKRRRLDQTLKSFAVADPPPYEGPDIGEAASTFEGCLEKWYLAGETSQLKQ